MVVLVVIAAVGYFGFTSWYDGAISASVDSSNSEKVDFKINTGDSSAAIGNNLASAGLIADLNAYNLYLRFSGKGAGFKAGTFRLSKSQTLVQIVDSLSGVGVTNAVRVTLLEGWSSKQVVTAVANAFTAKGSNTFTTASFNAIVAKPDTLEAPADLKSYISGIVPAGKSLEGLLYPDTYDFELDATAHDVIAGLVKNFRSKTSSLTIPSNFYSKLVLASIVEREAFTNAERTTVASVFVNRLAIGMKLESDATVNYATGDSNPRPTLADLRTDSPYNTYKYTGLPPTPISNPRLESIKAALEPAKTEYYFFIHEQDGSGQVHFAKTFAEHGANIRKYLD